MNRPPKIFLHVRMALLICGLASTAGCAGHAGTKAGFQTTASAVSQEGELNRDEEQSAFEPKPRLKAGALVRAELLRSELYDVQDDVETDGFINTYRIESKFGTFEAHGDAMLARRLHEIEVLKALAETPERVGFQGGVADSASRPLRGAWQFFKDPVDTLAGIGQGIVRWYTRVEEMVKGGRGEFEDTTAQELIGHHEAKRNWAYNLKVDVYSSNKVLQEALGKVAWASVGGGLSVQAGLMFVSGIASFALSGPSTAKGMERILRDKSPEDLRSLNRQKLKHMGVNEVTRDQFLHNPWYSPRHETILVEALAKLDGVEHRERFVIVAQEAASEEEALFYQEMAEGMWAYHDLVSPGKEILVAHQLPVLYTEDQRLVLTMQWDYGWWSPQAKLISDAVTRFRPTDREVRQREIWVSGTFTPRCRKQFESRGWRVEEQARQKLMERHAQEQRTFIYRKSEDQLEKETKETYEQRFEY